MGSHPVAAVGRLVQKLATDSSVQKEKQHTLQYKKHRTHKTKIQNKKTNIKRIFKNVIGVIRK